MSRPPRIEYPGACYYLTGRALQGRKAFEDDLDYRTFEQVLSSVVHRFNWLLQSYVLMPDHYHLVVEVPEANLSKGMRQLNGVYTQHANRRHNSEGPLFHGRFKSILFEKESFLLPICRHAALNPNRLGLTKEPSTYEQSSYGALIGQKPMPDMLHPDDLYQQLSKKPKLAQAALRAFVETDQVFESPLNDRAHQVLLGTDAFVDRMQSLLLNSAKAKQAPKLAGRRKSLRVLFRGMHQMSRTERNHRITLAHLEYNYTLAEIGQHLGLHYTTVSKVVNASEKAL